MVASKHRNNASQRIYKSHCLRMAQVFFINKTSNLQKLWKQTLECLKQKAISITSQLAFPPKKNFGIYHSYHCFITGLEFLPKHRILCLCQRFIFPQGFHGWKETQISHVILAIKQLTYHQNIGHIIFHQHSKKSPTGPTERTPKPGYLIALVTFLGSVGKVPFNFWWKHGFFWNSLGISRNLSLPSLGSGVRSCATKKNLLLSIK